MAGMGMYVPGAGAGRKQIPLKKGYSLGHWIDKTNKEGDKLAGRRGRPEPISLEELAKHCSEDDMWMALQGKVYNVTPYVPYHPGGSAELMRAAGGDGTQLFHEIHPWINIERFLGKCYIGPLAHGSAGNSLLVPGQIRSSPLSRSAGASAPAKKMLRRPDLPGPAPRGVAGGGPASTGGDAKKTLQMPRKSSYQTQDNAVLVFYGLDFGAVGLFDSVSDRVVARADGSTVHVTIATTQGQYRVLMALSGSVRDEAIIEYNEAEGKLLVKLPKTEQSHWPTIGSFETEAYDAMTSSRGGGGCTLVAVHPLTHNTSVYSVLPPDSDGSWECQLGQHLQVRVPGGKDGGGSAVRSYTPIGSGGLLGNIQKESPPGVIQLLVKRYPDGIVSSHIAGLSLGDKLMCSKPLGAGGPPLDGLTSLGMVAAGTGITPMVPYVGEASRREIPVSLVFCNKSEKDILLKEELDLAEGIGFRTTHVLSAPTDEWKGTRGRVTADVLKSALAPPAPTTLVLICGPVSFCRQVDIMLRKLGHHTYVFS